MTSIVAPKIDADLPATPAHEWANETSSKLEETKAAADQDVTSAPPPFSTAGSTPGVEVPGGYPRGTESEAILNGPNSDTNGHGGILDMAKQYLPDQQDVQGVLLNATETARQYLPPSVAAYLPGGSNPTSLPSEEGPQKPLEHSDGVGSLPGNASETSVAKLPDERVNVHQSKATTPPTQEGPQKPLEHSGGVGALPGNASESSVAKLPDERAQNQGVPNVGQPTTSVLTPATNDAAHLDTVSNASVQAQLGETPSMTPIIDAQPPRVTGGVGDLPGGKSESAVAMLPDERKEGISQALSGVNESGAPAVNLTPRTHPLAAQGAVWKGVPLHEDYQKMDVHENHDGVDIANASNTSTIGLTSVRPRQDQPESNVAVSGHEPLSTPTPSAPSASLSGSRFTETSEANRKNHAEVDSTTTGGSGGSDGSRSVGETPRKPKLMDKLKGEVKVITGKLGGKEDKVEEGKRLMGKV